MKRITVMLLLLLVCSLSYSQGKRKLIGNKLQILDLKNAKILGLDSKGNAYDNSEYVQNKIDDLEIGTRNLIINRQDFELSNDGAVSNSNVYTTQDNGTTIWRVERDGELGRSYAYFSIPDNRLSSPLENGEYILSFDYTTTDNDGGLVRISGRGGMALESVYYYNNIVNKMGYWQRGFIPFEIKKNSQNLFLLIEPPNGSGSLLIKNIVVVRGTKLATDLPAPEDQVSDWAETNTEAFSYIKNKPTKLSQFSNDIYPAGFAKKYIPFESNVNCDNIIKIGESRFVRNSLNSPYSGFMGYVSCIGTGDVPDRAWQIATSYADGNNVYVRVLGRKIWYKMYTNGNLTKLSQLEADNIYTKTQSDARYMPSWDKDYNDLINKPTAQDFCEEVVTKNVSEIIDLHKLEPTTPQSIQDNPTSGFQYIACDLSLNSHYSHLKGKFPQGIPLNEYRLQVTPNQKFKVYEVDSLMNLMENKNYSIIDSIQFEKGIKYDITDYFNRFLKGLGMPGGLIYYTNAYLYLFAKPGTITPPAGQGRVSLFDKIEAVKEDTISFSVCGGIMENRRMIDENKNAKMVCSDRNYMPLSVHTQNVGHRMLTITNKHTGGSIYWDRFPFVFGEYNDWNCYTVSELRNIEGELNTKLQTAIKLKYSKPNDKNSLVMYIDTAFVDNISFTSLLPGEGDWQTFDCPNDATKYVKLKSEYIERGGHFYNYYGVELPLTDYVYGSCMAENKCIDTCITRKIPLGGTDTLYIDNKQYISTNITETGNANGGYLMRVNGNGWDNPSEIYIDKGHISIGVQNADKNTSKIDIKNGSILLKNFVVGGAVKSSLLMDNNAINVKSDTVSINSFFVLKPRDTPSSAQKGTIYYDSTDNKLKCYDGTAWHNLY